MKKRLKPFRRSFLFLSFLLCLLAVAAWIRSYFATDSFIWTTRQSNITGIASGMGRVDIVHLTADQSAFAETEDSIAFERPKPGFEYERKAPDSSNQWAYSKPERDWHLLGLQYRSGKILFMHARELSIPHWLLALLFALPPLVWFIRRRRKPLPGACVNCGYDLRATPDRCPECGRPVS